MMSVFFSSTIALYRAQLTRKSVFSQMFLLAQYTEENDISLGNIFNKVKIDAEDYSDVIEKLTKLTVGNVLAGDKLSIEKLSKSIGTSDNVILGYAQTLKNTNGNIDLTTASTKGLSKYLKKQVNPSTLLHSKQKH